MRFLLIFVFLLIISLSIDLDPFDAQKIRTSQISVTIEGEVEYPGTYTLNPYSELGDLLDLFFLQQRDQCLSQQALCQLHSLVFVIHVFFLLISKQKPTSILKLSILHQLCCICRLQNRHVLLIIINVEKNTVNARFVVLFFNSSFFPQHGTAAPGGSGCLVFCFLRED